MTYAGLLAARQLAATIYQTSALGQRRNSRPHRHRWRGGARKFCRSHRITPADRPRPEPAEPVAGGADCPRTRSAPVTQGERGECLWLNDIVLGLRQDLDTGRQRGNRRRINLLPRARERAGRGGPAPGRAVCGPDAEAIGGRRQRTRPGRPHRVPVSSWLAGAASRSLICRDLYTG